MRFSQIESLIYFHKTALIILVCVNVCALFLLTICLLIDETTFFSGWRHIFIASTITLRLVAVRKMHSSLHTHTHTRPGTPTCACPRRIINLYQGLLSGERQKAQSGHDLLPLINGKWKFELVTFPYVPFDTTTFDIISPLKVKSKSPHL